MSKIPTISRRKASLVILSVLLLFASSGWTAETERDSRKKTAVETTTSTDNHAQDAIDTHQALNQPDVPSPDPQMLPAPGDNWGVMSSGGGQTFIPGFVINGTLGQTAAGNSSIGNLGLVHGFWQNFLWYDPNCCGIYTSGFTGNTNCDIEGKRNIGDVVRLVDKVYVSKAPLCCPPEGNVNGDVDKKINLGDITTLIDHIYINKLQTSPCE